MALLTLMFSILELLMSAILLLDILSALYNKTKMY